MDSYYSDGLNITIDEENSEVTFEWNDETHPKWSEVFNGKSKEELEQFLIKHLTDVAEEVISKEEDEEETKEVI